MENNISAALQQKFNQYKHLSLRKLATATQISYSMLLKASKKPIEGQQYDPAATNWNAVAAMLLKRNIELDSIDWEALDVPARRAPALLSKDAETFKVGMKVYLRRNNDVPYVIAYKTNTHIVLIQEGTTEPIAWSNSTFLLNGPMLQPRTKRTIAEVEHEA